MSTKLTQKPWGRIKFGLALCVGFVGLATGCHFEPAEYGTGAASAPLQPFAKLNFVLLSWNVEFGGSEPDVIARELTEMDEYDLFCLTNVDPNRTEVYANALPAFQSVASPSDNRCRFQILFDESRFRLVNSGQLYGRDDGCAPPFYARFLDTLMAHEFLVVCTDMHESVEIRREQATALHEWANEQDVGVIGLGDFHLDSDNISSVDGNPIMEMLRDNIWQWVKPFESVDTDWNDPDGDGRDNSPGVMEDLAFVAGPAKQWRPECGVVVRECDFPDDDRGSSHRPIELFLSP